MGVRGIERVGDQLRDLGSKARPTWPTGSSGQESWTNSFFTPVSRMNDVSCGVTRGSAREAITVYFTPGWAIGPAVSFCTSDPPTMIWSQAGQPKSRSTWSTSGRRPR